MPEHERVIGGDEATLREFLYHYFNVAMWGSDEPTLYIQQLPHNGLPFELPLPENGQVIGSVVRGEFSSEVLLHTALAPEDVIEFYENALLYSGWQITTNFPAGPRGFVDRKIDGQRFCNNALELSMGLSVSSGSNGGSSARFHINKQANPCQPNHPAQNLHTVLPVLTTPKGVRLLPGSQTSMGGGGLLGRMHSATMSTTLETDLAINEVASAYTTRLERSGWQLLDSESGQRYAYSTWSFAREGTEYNGFFVLTAHPKTSRQYFAWVQVQEGSL